MRNGTWNHTFWWTYLMKLPFEVCFDIALCMGLTRWTHPLLSCSYIKLIWRQRGHYIVSACVSVIAVCAAAILFSIGRIPDLPKLVLFRITFSCKELKVNFDALSHRKLSLNNSSVREVIHVWSKNYIKKYSRCSQTCNDGDDEDCLNVVFNFNVIKY